MQNFKECVSLPVSNSVLIRSGHRKSAKYLVNSY